MTNLSPSASSPKLSREGILMAAPLLFGLFVAGGVVVWQLLPTNERIEELDARLRDVRVYQQQVPVLSQRLAAAENKLEQAQLQQAVLLDLIAGSDRIQTFLALLDQRARVAGVEIQRFEPMQEASSAKKVQSRQGGSSAPKSSSSTDPLQDLGYRRTSVALNVVGSYNQLHYFLQEMEKLEVVVEASDLNLEAASDSGVDDEDTAMTIQQGLALSLRFSFYDRLPANEPSTATPAVVAEEAPN